jgi:16S rRNA (guanine966-N2)-methyltransferase
MSLRVTGGRLSGRRLRTPRSRAVRPTSDRVRESLFAVLGDLEDASVLELYAGSGALGIEALSRGARRAVFVERAPAALAVLRENLAGLDLAPAARVVAADVAAGVRRLGREGERFDLVLLDPPYGARDRERALGALLYAGILAPGAQLVVERSRRHPLGAIPGLAVVTERRYGDTVLTWLERATAAAVPGRPDR